MSKADNLARNDRNGDWDVFLRDREKGETVRVSVGVGGADANGPSLHAVISGNGQRIAFNSKATNLVPRDLNGADDVFVYDRPTAKITRVSVGLGGSEPNGDSDRAAISFDGGRIAFSSKATNLIAGDNNNSEDVFVHDFRNGRTMLASVGITGVQMAAADEVGRTVCCILSLACCAIIIISDRKSVMSPDGNTLVYRSDATNLVPRDFNYHQDIFVYNIAARTTERVSVSSKGVEGNGTSVHHGVSFDGRYVAFSSEASNLVENDTNEVSDIFVHDRSTGITTRVSVPSP
jgi:Tol biopolymer transport system component